MPRDGECPLWKRLLRRMATPLTVATFTVSAITGVMLFFHVAGSSVRLAHEWLSLLFVVAVALHLWRNGAAVLRVVMQGRTLVIAGVAILTVALFVAASPMSGGGNPRIRVARAIEQALLSAVAPALGLSRAELIGRLEAGGVAGLSGQESLAQLSVERHIAMQRLFAIILPAERRR